MKLGYDDKSWYMTCKNKIGSKIFEGRFFLIPSEAIEAKEDVPFRRALVKADQDIDHNRYGLFKVISIEFQDETVLPQKT